MSSIKIPQLPPHLLLGVERPTVRENTMVITTTNEQVTTDGVHRGTRSYMWQWSVGVQHPPCVGVEVEGVEVVVDDAIPIPPKHEPLVPLLGVRTVATT